MIKIKKDSVIWMSTIGTLIASGLSLVLFLPVVPGLWEFILNADALFLPSLWQHLIVDHQSWATWYPSVVGFYFPDIMMFFVAHLFTTRSDYAAYIFFLIQLLQLGLAFALLMPRSRSRGVSPAMNAVAPSILVLLMMTHLAIITSSGSAVSESSLVFGPLVASAHHTGTIVLTLLSFDLILRFDREPKAIWLATWSLLGVIAVASDKLFIVMALVPTMAYGALRTFRKQTTLRALSKRIFLCAIIMVLGHQLWIVIGWWHRPAGVGGKFAQPADMLRSLLALAHDAKLLIQPEWWCITGPAALGLILLGLNLFRWLRQREPSGSENAGVLLLLGAVMPLVATIAKGLYNGLTAFRYVESLVVFPLFWAWSWCVYQLPSRGRQILLLATLAASVVAAGIAWDQYGKMISEGYYPPLVACLDQVSTSADSTLRHGYADYWNTKPIRIFSRNNLKVAQLRSEGVDDHWISSDQWSTEVGEATSLGQGFFVVTTRLNDAALSARFGLPQRELLCAGERVNIYGSSRK